MTTDVMAARLTRGAVRAAALWGLLMASAFASTPPIVDIAADTESVNLSSSLVYACPTLPVEDLSAARQLTYQALESGSVSFGYMSQPCWFRIQVFNRDDRPAELVLHSLYSALDYVSLFTQSAEQVSAQHSGSAEPFDSRPLSIAPIAFPITLQSKELKEFYLKIKTHAPFTLPLRITTHDAFYEQRVVATTWQGVLFGVGIGLFFYNLFLWMANSGRAYGFYLMHLTFSLLFFSAVQGFNYSWWPEWNEWNSRSPHIFILAALFSGTLFAREFLNTRRWLKVDRLLIGAMAIIIVVIIGILTLPRGNIERLVPLLMMLDLPILLFAGIFAWRKGQSEAPIFVISWGVFLVTETTVALSAYGILFRLDISLILMQMGLNAQLVLLSLALSSRINTLKDDRIKQEENIIRTRAESAAKGVFLATMSHEIRTPMNAVLGISQLLSATTVTREQRGYIDMLDSAGKSLLVLINNVLDYSKINSGHFEVENIDFELRSLLKECAAMAAVSAQEKLISVECVVERGMLGFAHGDATRLRQILMNILGNAVKFTDHGRIFLRANTKKIEDKSGFYLNVEVEDSGIGMSASEALIIFDEFNQANASVRRKYGGTGLGLAISKKMIEAMGGAISVRSEKSRGTTFSFSVILNSVEKPHKQHPKPVRYEKVCFPGLRVLVAEDNVVNQLVIAGLLRILGVDAVLCNDGQKVLDIIESGEQFDLLLMDCEMPVMDGYKATRQLRKREKSLSLPALPIIALTAYALPEYKEKCLTVGMSDYLSKPVALTSLQQALQRWCPSFAQHLIEKDNGKAEPARA